GSTRLGARSWSAWTRKIRSVADMHQRIPIDERRTVMDIDDEEFRRLIVPFDPAMGDEPPQPGSDRYRTILETAMHTDIDPSSELHAGGPRDSGRPRPRRRF